MYTEEKYSMLTLESSLSHKLKNYTYTCTHTYIHRMYPSDFTFELKLEEKQEIKKESRCCNKCEKAPASIYIKLLMCVNYTLGTFSCNVNILVYCKEHRLLKQEALNLNLLSHWTIETWKSDYFYLGNNIGYNSYCTLYL